MHIYKQRPACTFMAYGYTTKKNKRRNVRLFLQVFFFLYVCLLLKSVKFRAPCQFSVTLTHIDILFLLISKLHFRILVLESDNEGRETILRDLEDHHLRSNYYSILYR